MTTLATETLAQYPDAVKVFDVHRPAIWALFEVTWQGVRLVQTSCTEGEKLADQGKLLAGLAV